MSELPIIAAGSLLEFVLSDHQFSMPVSRVEYLHMGPMTFSVFLPALEETKLCRFIVTYLHYFVFNGTFVAMNDAFVTMI